MTSDLYGEDVTSRAYAGRQEEDGTATDARVKRV